MNPTSQAILSGQTQRIASVTPSRLVQRLAKATVAATFLLLVAGALVTGNKAAMSDPTWPKFVGHWYPRYWVGGLLYEDSHRVIASIVGFLTLGLALALQFRDPRPKLKKLGWGAFVLVVVQALLGGLIIHSIRHPLVSMVHGMVAQAFFCLVLAITVFTSQRWIFDVGFQRVYRDENASYLKLCKIATALAYAQVVLGTGVRHTEKVFLPYLITHICVGTALLGAAIWFVLKTFQTYKQVTELRRPALFVSIFMFFQIAMGIASIYANRARMEPEMAHPWDVTVSTAHLAGGALILAILFVTTLRANRILSLRPAPDSDGHAPSVATVSAAV